MRLKDVSCAVEKAPRGGVYGSRRQLGRSPGESLGHDREPLGTCVQFATTMRLPHYRLYGSGARSPRIRDVATGFADLDVRPALQR